MRSFDFLGTWIDSWQIIEYLINENKYTLIPDLNYPSSDYATISELTQETRQLLQQRRHLCIWSNSFSINPPVLKQIQGENGDTWYNIASREGGPYLSLVLPPCYLESGCLNLAPGNLSYQKLYLDTNSNEWFAPTNNLIAAFKHLVIAIKMKFARRHQIHKPIWAGKNAIIEILENNAKIHGYGLD